jgi:hypothetical protein
MMSSAREISEACEQRAPGRECVQIHCCIRAGGGQTMICFSAFGETLPHYYPLLSITRLAVMEGIDACIKHAYRGLRMQAPGRIASKKDSGQGGEIIDFAIPSAPPHFISFAVRVSRSNKICVERKRVFRGLREQQAPRTQMRLKCHI